MDVCVDDIPAAMPCGALPSAFLAGGVVFAPKYNNATRPKAPMMEI